MSHRYKYNKNICVKVTKIQHCGTAQVGPSSDEREKVGEEVQCRSLCEVQFSKAKKSVREKEELSMVFFLMEIVVNSSLSFPCQEFKRRCVWRCVESSSNQDDEDGSICKRIEYNKRTDELQESRWWSSSSSPSPSPSSSSSASLEDASGLGAWTKTES